MNDIGELLIYSVGLVFFDLACGTSYWVMGCCVDIILGVDSGGEDEDGIFLLY
jgi:hypothetical protein